MNKEKTKKKDLQLLIFPLSIDEVWCEPTTSENRKLVASRYFEPNLNKDINLWSRLCIPCQKSKVNRHKRIVIMADMIYF